MRSHANVVIVGGGPIGLAYAFGIKKINPALHVKILEKYPQYQRSHTLNMQYKQLIKLMQATSTKNDATLQALLKQLQADPHIRTNELEAIFKKYALSLGVEIVNEEVKAETIDQQLRTNGKKPQFIIGADGTHSTVSDALFPEGNQLKYEFDYVLQLRYEVNGKQKTTAISSVQFYQDMARQGMIGNEYVGHYENGKTPVTMQMMISREAFYALKKATSKTPMRPYVETNKYSEDEISNLKMDDLPAEVRNFLTRYIENRIKACHLEKNTVDRNTIRISVNEAPATQAKQVFTDWHGVPVLLVGDAALGLSYFKGLNAGIESAAKCLSFIAPALTAKQKRAALKVALAEYQSWFDAYAPSKVKEVAQYSTRNIRSALKAMKVIRHMKMASMQEREDDQELLIRGYFNMLADDSNIRGMKMALRRYPHRAYDPVTLGQFAFVDYRHTLKKILKLFKDFFKPYKSTAHFVQDLKLPLVSLQNIGSGFIKIIYGLVKLKGNLIADGLLTLTRGLIELAFSLTPLQWFLKPLMRGVATLIHKPKIEENDGMQRLRKMGMHYVKALDEAGYDNVSGLDGYKVLAILQDMNRKYEKATMRGQSSKIKPLQSQQYQTIKAKMTGSVNVTDIRSYFSLFAKKKHRQAENGQPSKKQRMSR